LLILASLAAVGVAYGQWVETLSVNGTVTTGEVEVVWTGSGCYDEELYATIGRSQVDPHTIQVTLAGAYPGYTGYCWANFRVGGSLPVRIKSIDFAPGADLTCSPTVHDPDTGLFTATCDELTVTWTNGLCTYFNVGGSEGSNMQVTIGPEAEESTTYDFTVRYTFEQANTSNCP
jgi:hypothetical protein